MPEATAGAGEGDPLADLGLAVLKTLVHSHTLRIQSASRADKGVEERRLTAQRMEAAPALSRPSGMGVTWWTNETWPVEIRYGERLNLNRWDMTYDILGEGAVDGVPAKLRLLAVCVALSAYTTHISK